MEHCKLLSLAHCHCYVVAVYKSLALQQSLSYEDMEAAVAQCEENLIEINITNYLRSVCRHLSTLSESSLLELKVSACNDVKPLHSLIKDKFKRIMAVAFKPVPAHPEFYYCLPSSEKIVRFFILCHINLSIVMYLQISCLMKIKRSTFRKWCHKGQIAMTMTMTIRMISRASLRCRLRRRIILPIKVQRSTYIYIYIKIKVFYRIY